MLVLRLLPLLRLLLHILLLLVDGNGGTEQRRSTIVDPLLETSGSEGGPSYDRRAKGGALALGQRMAVVAGGGGGGRGRELRVFSAQEHFSRSGSSP